MNRLRRLPDRADGTTAVTFVVQGDVVVAIGDRFAAHMADEFWRQFTSKTDAEGT